MTNPSTMLKIATLTALKEGDIFKASIKNTSIIITKSGNVIKAFEGTCPHQGADLSQGHIENDHIVCPMHGRKFSCTDGSEKQFDSCLKEYQLEIDGDDILINEDLFTLNNNNTNKEDLIKFKDLPTPKGKPIVGHLPDFKQENKHQVIENWAKETGDLFKISLMGKKFIVSADPDINGEILKSRPHKFQRFSKIGEIMEEMGITGVFSVEGDTWAKHRKITAEALSLKNVKGFFPILSSMTERLLHRWQSIADTNKTIDVQKEMTFYTVDMTTLIAFGYDTQTLLQSGDVIQDHMEKIFPMINKRITAPLPLWRYIKSKTDKEFDISLKEVQETVSKFIKESKEKLIKYPELKETPSNFLEALLAEQEKENTFSDKEIFGNVFTILLAGEDTTSNTISWTLFYLATHPEVFKKVREEADEMFGGHHFAANYDQMQELKYTEAVANEAIRIKPATPTLIMQALEDTTVKNLAIKKGTSVLMQNKVAQTDEKYFENADQFIPERWLKDAPTSGCPFHGKHSPDMIKTFGGGARFCPGKNLAIQELKMGISMICKNFNIELAVKPEEVKEVFAFTMYPKNLLFKLKSRARNPVKVKLEEQTV